MDIGKDWRIKSDSMNVILEHRKRVPAKDGKPAHDRWFAYGFYSRPENALHALTDQEVRDTQLKDLKEVVEAIEKTHKMIQKALSERPSVLWGMS